MNFDATITCHESTYGRAVRLEWPDVPDAAESVCGWVIDAPAYHPLWSQYHLAVVRLRDDVPGFPPPRRKFIGATHELNVVALNPEAGAYTEADAHACRPLPYLLPVNIAEQFEGTDPEMEQLAWFAAWGVTIGLLNPETGDAPTAIREHWLGVLTKTLAHIRGEEHAP